MTAESSSDNLSAPSSVVSVDTTINQQQQQRTAWAQVVRGEHEASEEVSFSDCSKETQMENSDSNQSNVDHPKKPAWNKPLNGVVGVGPVMGGDVSWPALSESTKAPFKSASDSSKPISDSSVSTSQVPVISHSPKKHANTNPNPNFTPNHTMPVRQRFSKRGGGTGGGSVHSGFNRPPPPPPPPLPLPLPLPLPPLPPPFPLYEMPYSALVAAVPDSSIGEPPYKGNSWEGRPIGGFGSQSHSVNDHSSHRNSSRRGNFNSHGSRRDQDRDWNASRSSNARDVHLSPHQIAPPGGFIRSPSPPPPPPPPAGYMPFIAPPSVRHFGNHMGFDMTSSFWYVPSGVPLISHAPPPPPPMFSPVANLPASLLNQINYYFSDDNLVRDDFLRSNMDDEGWVPITLIAGFPRIQQLTVNIKLILDSLRTSSVVEVKDYKVRRRYSWKKWIPKYGWFGTDSGSQSLVGSTYNTITTSLQKVTLDEAIANQSSITGKEDSSTGAVPCRGSSEDLTNHSKLANGECIIEEACSSQI